MSTPKHKGRGTLKWTFLAAVCLTPTLAFAIPPPDFLFNFISQIPQIIAIFFLIIAASFGTGYQYLKIQLSTLRRRPLLLVVNLLVIATIAVLTSYFYAKHSYELEFENWRHAQMAKVSQTPKSVQDGRAEKGLVFKDATTLAPSDLMISNSQLKGELASGRTDFVVVDTREGIEFELGHIPGSRHIRMADLMNDNFDSLPTNQYVYVVCYLALRGSEVAQHLRSKGISARYLEEGISKWIKDGGAWEGEDNLSRAYHQPQHSKRFGIGEFAQLQKAPIVVVDSRPAEKFNIQHLQGSFNISSLTTPSDQLTTRYAQIPPHSRVVIVCDDHWSCFDGFITGIGLEKRGHEYLGRFENLTEYFP